MMQYTTFAYMGKVDILGLEGVQLLMYYAAASHKGAVSRLEQYWLKANF
jgi:hypothetical protein